MTWKGKLDGEGLALLPFTGSSEERGRVRLQGPSDLLGRQASSTGRAPRIPIRPRAVVAVGAAGHGAEASHSDSSKTIAIIALVVGALGLLIGGAGLVAGRRSG